MSDAVLLRDERTGFLHLADRPGRDAAERFYAETFYSAEKPDSLLKNAREQDYWQPLWQLRLALIAQHAGGVGRILDVGAGGGFFLDCARRCGWEIAGVEPGRQAVAYARETLAIELIPCMVEELAAAPASFDAVHMALVLEHVRDPRAVLAAAARLLRPGGALWVEVPNDFNPLQLAAAAELGKPQWWVVPDHHVNYFDYDSLGRLLAESGFSEVERLASFPMEMLLLLGFDYVGHAEVGSDLHARRMAYERALLERDPPLLLALARAFAQAGVGRSCNLLAVKRGGG